MKKKNGIILLFIIIIMIGIYGIFNLATHHHQSATNQTNPTIERDHYLFDRRNVKSNVRDSPHKLPHLEGTKDAKEVLALDYDTNQVLYAKNAYRQNKIASLAKLMSLYLVARKAKHLPNGWQQRVNVADPNLKRMSHNPEFNGGFKFKANTYTVRQLYQAAIVGSSDSATIALGKWVAGNNQKFIQDMNKQAKLWKLNAHFVSASGLENDDLAKYGFKIAGNNKTGNEVSAFSTAIIARNILKENPAMIKDTAKNSEKVAGQILVDVNALLNGGAYYGATEGLNVDGLKTGFTNSAGLCFVATAHPKGKHRIILVVINDPNIFTNSAKMLKGLYHPNQNQVPVSPKQTPKH